MAAGMPELGSKISLISKADIRYEGRLFTVDPSECTIALANVRSYGTEDRDAQFPIAPQNLVYDYILFRGSDIKDIRVVNNVAPIPQDPAIMQMHMHPGQGVGGNGGPGGMMGPGPVGGLGYPGQQQPFQPQGGMSMGGVGMPGLVGGMGGYNAMGGLGGPLGPGGMGGMAPGANMAGLHKTKQTTSVLDLIGGASRSTTPISMNSRKSPEPGMQTGFGGGNSNDIIAAARRANANAVRSSIASTPTQGSVRNKSTNNQSANISNNQNRITEHTSTVATANAKQRGATTVTASPDANRQQQQQQQRSQPFHGNNQQNRGWNNTRAVVPQQQIMQGGVLINNANHPMNSVGQQMRGQQPQQQLQQRNRGGRGPINQGGYRQSINPNNPNKTGGPGRAPKTTIKFESDYDFEQANNKFEELRLELAKLKVGDDAKPEQVNGEADKKDDSGNETGAGEHEQEDDEVVAGAPSSVVGYDKAKSFFDNISCEAATDRTKGKNRTDWRHERKINSETFGVSARRGGFFNFRGRGGYYNRNNQNNQLNPNQQGGGIGGGNSSNNTMSGYRQNNNSNGGYRQNNGGYRGPRNYNNRSYQNQSTGIPVQPTTNKQIQPHQQQSEQQSTSSPQAPAATTAATTAVASSSAASKSMPSTSNVTAGPSSASVSTVAASMPAAVSAN